MKRINLLKQGKINTTEFLFSLSALSFSLVVFSFVGFLGMVPQALANITNPQVLIKEIPMWFTSVTQPTADGVDMQLATGSSDGSQTSAATNQSADGFQTNALTGSSPGFQEGQTPGTTGPTAGGVVSLETPPVRRAVQVAQMVLPTVSNQRLLIMKFALI